VTKPLVDPRQIHRQTHLALWLLVGVQLMATPAADARTGRRTNGAAAARGDRAEEPATNLVTEAALRAHDAIEDHCPDPAGDEMALSGEAVAALSAAWADTERALENSGDILLLFWTGSLEHCLCWPERARRDLDRFLTAADQAGRRDELAGLTATAHARLRQLGGDAQRPAVQPAADREMRVALAAADANDANQTFCSDAYSTDVAQAAGATKQVLEAWSGVDQAYAETGESMLLYWRGVLAQCLGRPDTATEDLLEFTDDADPSGPYANMVEEAGRRLKRLDRKRELGSGAAARHLSRDLVFEGRVAYRGGLAIYLQGCGDDPDAGAYNYACAGGEPLIKNALLGMPAATVAWLAVYPAPQVGLRAGVSLRPLTRSYLGVDPLSRDGEHPDVVPGYPLTAVGPVWSITVGPVFRVQPHPEARKRTRRVLLSPLFYLHHERISPWAGNMAGTQQLVYAGTYGWTLPGAGFSGELDLQLSAKLALALGGAAGICIPTSSPSLQTVMGPSAEYLWAQRDLVEQGSEHNRLAPIGLDAGFAGLHVGLVLPAPDRSLAFEPRFSMLWETSRLRFGDDPQLDVWVEDVDPGSKEVLEERKVYSTRQHLISVGIELAIRFGRERADRTSREPPGGD
jgi:hypothetical protein